MTAQTNLGKLEKKVDLLSKAMHILLFKEKEKISRKEALEIEKRLSAYMQGDKREFVDLEDALNAKRQSQQAHTV